MKVVPLDPRIPDKTGALETIETLREKIESGECVGFAAVAVGPDDSTYSYTFGVGHVSRLRIMGAITNLLHSFVKGD